MRSLSLQHESRVRFVYAPDASYSLEHAPRVDIYGAKPARGNYLLCLRSLGAARTLSDAFEERLLNDVTASCRLAMCAILTRNKNHGTISACSGSRVEPNLPTTDRRCASAAV
ncbi:uncharacterized [Tachysurus ichikawai]